MIETLFSRFGIDIYGITDVTDFSYLKNYFYRKKEAGFFTRFEDDDFEKRRSVSNLFSSPASIISIVFPYDTGESPPDCGYTISKYAARNDYHFVVKKLLSVIIDELKKIYPKNRFEIFVDSNPLFEKEIAQKSGTGFYGKNGIIFTEKYGSYVFLGEIITDAHLAPVSHTPAKECLNCGLCQELCPNNCYESGIFNSKKCISYLTQEKKIGDEDLKIGTSLWGCDICQDVCPLNSKREYSHIPEFSLKKELFLPLETLSKMSNKELKDIFGSTPIGWSGMGVIRRNSEIILKNIKRG